MKPVKLSAIVILMIMMTIIIVIIMKVIMMITNVMMIRRMTKNADEREPVKLSAIVIPLDRVKWFTLQVVSAGQARSLNIVL